MHVLPVYRTVLSGVRIRQGSQRAVPWPLCGGSFLQYSASDPGDSMPVCARTRIPADRVPGDETQTGQYIAKNGGDIGCGNCRVLDSQECAGVRYFGTVTGAPTSNHLNLPLGWGENHLWGTTSGGTTSGVG